MRAAVARPTLPRHTSDSTAQHGLKEPACPTFGGCGILLVRRTNVTARLLFSSSARKAKLNCGEAAAWACFRHTQPSARIAHNSGVARLHCLSRVDVSQPQAWEDSVLQGRKQTALAWA